MPETFTYKARDRSGGLISGKIAADSEQAVAAFIRDKGYFVTQIKKMKETGNLEDYISKLRGVKPKEVAVFCRQMSIMVNAGLPLVTAVGILIEQTYNPVLKKALQDIYQQIQGGDTFSSAVKQYDNIFPQIMIHMITAGEVGGVLDDVMNRLSVHLEKDYKMREKIKSAMTYPIVVISLAVLVVIFILTFVMPTFMTMFAQMNSELPLPTQILLGVSGFFQDYWWLVIIGLVAGVFGLAQLYKMPRYQLLADSMILRMPVFGMLVRKVSIAKFSRTLGTLLHGGVPIITALDVVKNITGNMELVNALTTAQSDVRDGFTLSDTLKSTQVFTPMVVQMIAVGEETGQMDTMLEKIADFYEDDVDDVVSRLSSLLEPMMILILGVIIGSIVVSIALPMFDVVNNVGG